MSPSHTMKTKAVCSSAMLVPIYRTTRFHIPGVHKFSTHHFEDLQSHLPALFVLMSAAILLTGSCWADRVQTAECRTGRPYSRTESWTASSCVSLPVVPLWTWQSGLRFHTCTHKVAPHNTTVFWRLKFDQHSVPTSYQILTYLLTYSMEQSPSWETNWFAASQEVPRILWKLKVHYHIHKCPPPVPILTS